VEELRIESRFCGPPGVANGGYVAGLLAERLRGAVEVRLRAPAPLELPLTLQTGEGGQLALLREGRILAEASVNALDLEPPPAPDERELAARAGSCRALRTHPFPRCFVCGPERAAEDGLRILPGWHPDLRCAAAAWCPAEELGDGSGVVRPRFVWSALDCTSAFPLLEDPANQRLEPMVLARLAASQMHPVRALVPHAITAWMLDLDERGGTAGVALRDAGGVLCAIGRARWVSLAGRKPLQSS
jgi:hypothetical protein